MNIDPTGMLLYLTISIEYRLKIGECRSEYAPHHVYHRAWVCKALWEGSTLV